MSYNKKTWISHEVITHGALNNIEEGISSVESKIPTKISQLENDSNYAKKNELHEHENKNVLDGINLVRVQAWDNAANGDVDLDNYVTKETFEEFANNSVEHIFITETEYEALPEEDKNKDNALYLITDTTIEYVSIEQYNALLERIEQLETALNGLSS